MYRVVNYVNLGTDPIRESKNYFFQWKPQGYKYKRTKIT